MFHEPGEALVLQKGVVSALDLRISRKVMGKKLHLEAIAEVNIYKFLPWDLPDKSCLRSKDLEWFFFCPREKKYASGVRVKRATENGYWKVTGKDRPVYHNNKTVGTVKTLVFHLGHAPKGERTDWVLHEYMIRDNQLAEAGVQDTFVLCKVFKKNGLGPKNGAQYGAPFNEADWSEDDVDDVQNHAVSLASDGPSPTTLMMIEEQSCPPVTRLFGPENNRSGSSLIKDQSTSSGHPTSEVFADKTDDEIVRLLAQFTDDDMMIFHENGVNQDDLSGRGKKYVSCSDGFDVYNGLGDLDSWSRMNEDRLDFWRMQNDQNSLENQLLLDNSSYIELDDLMLPLNCPAGFTENVQSSIGETFKLHENIKQSVVSGVHSASTDQYAAFPKQLPVLPVGSCGNNSLNLPQMVNNSLYQGEYNASYDLDFALGQPHSGVNSAQDIERVSEEIKCIFAKSLPECSMPCGTELSTCDKAWATVHFSA
ncbi:NAC domain-containing protein 78 [Phtheirospermum japonicum]|uniref:NAC domain-containing protein 78 n=1 Tax=Phtheirospermum japonicum TaxID=374723 RepID=A0A830CIL1_9LAMI|nr:NAC domain-containing protein 78 [Phtheirospermum japonicum]